MNYRHGYHAGNFADVFKHTILIALIKSFFKKENPFFYLDTHAGAGYYDLSSDAAQKTKEFENGIAKIVSQHNPPELIKDYLRAVMTLNPDEKLHYYPGSPVFVSELMRANDRAVLSELHAEEHQSLKNFILHHSRIATYHQDAYQSLKAFLPPKERRGLVLIDPPYEKPDEFSQLIKIIPNALKRWETGVYALWYPIKNRSATNRFTHALKEKINRPLLSAELSIYPPDAEHQLNGCGMLIINPPWKLEQELKTVLPWLWNVLSIRQQGGWRI